MSDRLTEEAANALVALDVLLTWVPPGYIGSRDSVREKLESLLHDRDRLEEAVYSIGGERRYLKAQGHEAFEAIARVERGLEGVPGYEDDAAALATARHDLRNALAASEKREQELQDTLTAAMNERQEKVILLSSALRDVEGSLLAYWTDIPQEEVERLLGVIRPLT